MRSNLVTQKLFALALFCFAAPGHASGGLYDGLTPWLMAVALIWLGLILLLFLLLRKASPVWRYVVLGPLIAAPAGLLIAYTLSTIPDTTNTRIAKSPVSLGSATFPAGSEVEYRPSQNSQQPDVPFRVHSDTPVQLGNLEILGLELGRTENDLIQIELSHEQPIEGWICRVSDLELSRVLPNRLFSCYLGVPRTLGAVTWPSNTYVSHDRQSKTRWFVIWRSDNPGNRETTTSVFDMQIRFMEATYDASLKLTKLQLITKDRQLYDCESDIPACLEQLQTRQKQVPQAAMPALHPKSGLPGAQLPPPSARGKVVTGQ